MNGTISATILGAESVVLTGGDYQEIEIHDRYSAAGIPRPDPETMCDECDGMGCYPVHKDTEDEQDKALWLEADARLRNAACFFRQLWKHKEFWFWRSMLRGLFDYGVSNWACDDWHFVTCPHCNGSRVIAALATQGEKG